MLTNAFNLPAPIVAAIQNDPYDRGDADISVTQLPAPPRQVALKERHRDELTEDAADRIWSLLGQSVHTILERANVSGLAEQRLYLDDVLGWRVSGAFDHLAYLPDGLLSDYKVSSTWSVRDGGKPEWVAQLNLLALLLRAHEHVVSRLQVVVICRDWRKNEALRYGSNGYPQKQVAVVPIPLWSPSEAEAYLHERVRLHQAARAALAANDVLVHCTHEERWQRPDAWALKKDGRKTAVKLYATAAEAEAVAKDSPLLSVEYRPGLAVRCSQYCAALPMCRARDDGQFQPGDLAEGEDV